MKSLQVPPFWQGLTLHTFEYVAAINIDRIIHIVHNVSCTILDICTTNALLVSYKYSFISDLNKNCARVKTAKEVKYLNRQKEHLQLNSYSKYKIYIISLPICLSLNSLGRSRIRVKVHGVHYNEWMWDVTNSTNQILV